MTLPSIILVEPQMGENIGAAARSMANFGLSDLRLVAPRDGWPNEKAITMAAGTLDKLVNVTVFEDFDSAIADLQFLLATTARLRDMVKPVYDPKDGAQKIAQNINMDVKCGLLFGRERNGLENDEVAKAHGILNVPTSDQYSSINLAQAVLLMGYELFQCQNQVAQKNNSNFQLAERSEVQNFLNRLEHSLEETGFFRATELKPTMIRNITNIFTRGDLTAQEVNTLQGILSALSRK